MTTQQHIILKEKKYLYGALLLLGTLVVAYMYVVSSTVLQVVAREQIADQIVELQSEISRVESDYMLAQHEISKDIAFQNGFVAAEEKYFITRTNTTFALNE